MKTFQLTKFHTKLLSVQNLCVLGSIKCIDLLRSRYLVLFAPETYNAIYDRMKYLISVKNGFTHSINKTITDFS